jgi:hypothetical protein
MSVQLMPLRQARVSACCWAGTGARGCSVQCAVCSVQCAVGSGQCAVKGQREREGHARRRASDKFWAQALISPGCVPHRVCPATGMMDMMQAMLNAIHEMRDELRGEMSLLREELRGEMSLLRGEMSLLRDELRGEMSLLRDELRGEMSHLRDDLKKGTGALREDLGRTKEELLNWTTSVDNRRWAISQNAITFKTGARGPLMPVPILCTQWPWASFECSKHWGPVWGCRCWDSNCWL